MDLWSNTARIPLHTSQSAHMLLDGSLRIDKAFMVQTLLYLSGTQNYGSGIKTSVPISKLFPPPPPPPAPPRLRPLVQN